MKTSLLMFFLFAPWAAFGEPVPIFDGKTFDGWEGEITEVWRIENEEIRGGSMEGNPQNEFLVTKKAYRNFRLALEYKLNGSEGLVNGGVQFHSKRLAQPAHEMIGFQADLGAGYTGNLYDESRRNKMLASADPALVTRLEKPGEWNRYEIHAEDNRFRIILNGTQTIDYSETDPAIPLEGQIGLQIHGGCKAVIAFRNLKIEEIPAK